MLNSAYSQPKDEIKNFNRPNQILSKNNSITFVRSGLEKELAKPGLAGELGKEDNLFISVFNFFKNFKKEISEIGKSQKDGLVKNSIFPRVVEQHEFYSEIHKFISQYYISQFFTNNSLKDYEKSLWENLIKKGFHNALAPENEIKIRDLIELSLSEINEYLTLEENWDGYNARKFNKDTISLAGKILNDIKTNLIVENFIPEEITPGPASDGSLTIEVLFKTKDLIFTILPNTTNEIAIYTNDGIINKETIIRYPSDLRIYFEWLRRG